MENKVKNLLAGLTRMGAQCKRVWVFEVGIKIGGTVEVRRKAKADLCINSTAA